MTEECIEERNIYGFKADSSQTGELALNVGCWNPDGKLGYHVDYRKVNRIEMITEGKKTENGLWAIRSQK